MEDWTKASRRLLSIGIINLLGLLFAGAGFYFNTRAFEQQQRERNASQDLINSEIKAELSKKASIDMVLKIYEDQRADLREINAKLDRLIERRAAPLSAALPLRLYGTSAPGLSYKVTDAAGTASR